jgi:hypothetical protein
MPDRWRVLGVKLLPHEYDDLCELAEMSGMPLSDVVRQALRLPSEDLVRRDRLLVERRLQLVGGER